MSIFYYHLISNPPILPASSRLGRALAELFGLLVKLCVGSPCASAAFPPCHQHGHSPHACSPRHRLLPHQAAYQGPELAATTLHPHPPIQVGCPPLNNLSGENLYPGNPPPPKSKDVVRHLSTPLERFNSQL